MHPAMRASYTPTTSPPLATVWHLSTAGSPPHSYACRSPWATYNKTTFAEILKISLNKIAENLTFLPSFAENLIIHTLVNVQILTIMAHKQRPRHREAFV